jgi:GTPase SAR1 family protein
LYFTFLKIFTHFPGMHFNRDLHILYYISTCLRIWFIESLIDIIVAPTAIILITTTHSPNKTVSAHFRKSMFNNVGQDVLYIFHILILMLWNFMNCNLSNYRCSYFFTGDTGYDRVRPLSYGDADLVIICFSVGDRESMENVVSRVSLFPQANFPTAKL